MLESIAFIPDGNRRYAKMAGISLAESYSIGTQRALDVVKWVSKYPSLKVGTFYTFSLKNFERSKLELDILFKIFEKQLDGVKQNSLFEENEVSLKFIGRREMFPSRLQEKMSVVEENTSRFKKKQINLALGYDGQTEIVDAAQKFALDVQNGNAKPEDLSVGNFQKYLYSDFKAPDLIVRTSNEQRLSGFLTYQSSYSELAFIDKYWPQITETDVDNVINSYEQRERRFGK
jgi:tritrans,polycis-undecaprenyl-diphosphate synthase [geranylgeranyl-diphosphate specific]